jgi:hypothetical protein
MFVVTYTTATRARLVYENAEMRQRLCGGGNEPAGHCHAPDSVEKSQVPTVLSPAEAQSVWFSSCQMAASMGCHQLRNSAIIREIDCIKDWLTALPMCVALAFRSRMNFVRHQLRRHASTHHPALVLR